MRYFSLNNRAYTSTFKEAVISGLAPDKGLYFPETIDSLPNSFFENIKDFTKTELALQVISSYVGDEIPKEELLKIIEETLDFEFPLVPIEDNIQVLELFHGPTMAFKDVGARFMAGCLSYFIKKGELGRVTVLVATSGDTGGAVANGFLGVDGIDVVILYPKGKVSEIQEKQLTTLGENIVALEVDGTFDDCQDMVKKAFLDEEIKNHRRLTSANSINVARWLPQMFYYFIAYQQILDINKKLIVSVPSGNFGNICAGMLASKMGLPIAHFIAASNANDVVGRYLDSSNYEPRPSVQTISNAMDVGNPSNFIRIQELFNNDIRNLKTMLTSYSFSDVETKAAMQMVYEVYGYIMDPHGAVGYLGLQEFLKKNTNCHGIFLETAHPVKFLETVESVLSIKLEIPLPIQTIIKKEKRAINIKDYIELKAFLLS
jgi:threonine synthase